MTAQFARAPHAGRSATTLHEPHAALLIDFDNVTMGIRSDLSKELKTLLNSDIIKGKVAVQRAYADWRRYPQYIVPLAESSVDLIYAPAYGSQKKNATDIRLAIDALELVFTRPEIGTYILLSGDSDFSSLVLKLKEYGKYVVGVGIRESASDLLVQNCDEYYSYSALTGLKRTSEDSVTASYDVWELVEMAVQRMVSDGDVMRSDRLKQVLLKLDPNFDEKTIGYSKFNRFIQEAAKRGALRLQKLENGQYEVAPPGGEAAVGPVEPEPVAAEVREPREREEGRRRGRRGRGGRREAEPAGASASNGAGEAPRPAEPAAPPPEQPAAAARPPEAAEIGDGMDAAFDLLRRAVRDVADGGAARDSDVKRRMLEIRADWDEADYGFSKFSRFLRHAHDADVVTLERLDNGNYEVRLSDGKGPSDETDARRRRGRGRDVGAADRAVAPAAESEKREPGRREEPKKPVAVPAEAPAAASKPAEAPAAVSKPAAPTETAAASTPASAREDRAAAPARAEKADAKATAPAPAGGRTLGPRRGSRGGRPGAEGPPPLLAGQTVRPAGAAPAAPAGAPAEKAPQAADKPPGRARKKRGRTKAAAEAPSAPQTKPSTAPTFDPAALGLPTDSAAVVDYVTNSYKGVGKKSAEQLVEAFGAANVFAVLEAEPKRARDVLGEARGTKLLEAWDTDRAQRRAGRAAPASGAEPDAGAAGGSTSRGARRSRGKRGGRGRKKAPSTA